MIRCEVMLEVGRPPADVFAFVDDIGKAPQWLGRCVEIQQTSPPPKRVGTTLRYFYKEGGRRGEMDGVVTEYEKDKRLAMSYSDKMFDVAVAFRFEPSGFGTKVQHNVEITPKAFVAKLMSPMIGAATRKQVERDTAKLKGLLLVGGGQRA